MRGYTREELKTISLEDFAKALAICLGDEVAFAGADAAEYSLEVLRVAAIRLDIAEELNDADSLGGYGFGAGDK